MSDLAADRNGRKALLVVFHEATRTGSPRVLSQLLGQLRGRLPWPIHVDILAGGPLERELADLGSGDRSTAPPTAVLINSALAAAEALEFDRSVRTAVYVHEVGEALETLPPDARSALRDRCDQVWCVSAQSERDLAALGVPADRLSVLPPVVTTGPEPSKAEQDMLLERLGVTADRRLVVGCGEASWRKGADLFLDVSRRLGDDPSLCFVWAGRKPRAFGRLLDHDTRRLGMGERLTWAGELDSVAALLRRAEVVVVPSREDPQPLVPLEAALWETPSVGFDTGGLRSLADHGAAVCVPYPDTAALAAAAGDLLSNEARRTALAGSARNFTLERHSMEVLAPRFEEAVRSLVEAGGVAPDTNDEDELP